MSPTQGLLCSTTPSSQTNHLIVLLYLLHTASTDSDPAFLVTRHSTYIHMYSATHITRAHLCTHVYSYACTLQCLVHMCRYIAGYTRNICNVAHAYSQAYIYACTLMHTQHSAAHTYTLMHHNVPHILTYMQTIMRHTHSCTHVHHSEIHTLKTHVQSLICTP